MIRKLIPVIIFLPAFVFLQAVSGQAELFTPDYISQKFQNYCKLIPREEIFIHTDREEYISGEDLWFNIYLIDRQSFKPSLNSKIAYLELLSPENRPLIQRKILLDKGFGPGQIVLPDTLSSGTYSIRAYTSWMKNFLPYNCFLKDIKVYNPLRAKPFLLTIKPVEVNGSALRTRTDNSGLNMKVNNLKQDSLVIVISTDEKFRAESNNSICLFIQTHGVINYLSTCKIANETTRVAIPKNMLYAGINQITVFNNKGPVVDRFVYTPGKEKQALTLYNTSDSYKKRNKVTPEIEIENGMSGINDLTNFSISVATKTDLPDIMDLDEYLILGTEFGLFTGNLIKGRKITELSREVMDSLLLTIKSNWIKWADVFSNKAQIFRYPSENEYYTISGKLLTENLQPVYADEIILMSTPGKEAVFQYTTTDQEGNFEFRIPIDDEIKDLIFQPDIDRRNQKIYIESPFSDQYLPCEMVVDSSDKPLPVSVTRQRINYQIRKIYSSFSAGNCSIPAIPSRKSARFYGTPDFEIIMRDYIRLDSMPEVFSELVPHVTLKKINSGYEISVIDAFNKRLEGIPCVMIDGLIIKDLSLIAKLNPDLIEKIDVVSEKYRVGNYIFNGIVNVISKKGDFSIGTLPSDALRLHNRILDPVCSFVSPDYSTTGSRNSPDADYRSTLYWNPSVKPDKNGRAMIEFWTADVYSDYIINILGITSEGRTISFSKKISVR